MRKYICVFILVLIVGSSYSEEWKLSDIEYFDRNENYFRFHTGNKITGFKNGNLAGGVYSGSFIIQEEYGVSFLIITWNDNTSDKYLLVYNSGHMYLYNSNSVPFFIGTSNDYIPKFPYATTDTLSSTSALREGNIVYSTDNLDERIGICWAEGVSGNGIGEKILFKYENYTDGLRNVFYISTGFVSYDKPYLYRYNSRPKKIKISYEGERAQIIELADTPNLQRFEIWWPFPNWGSDQEENNLLGKDLWIEILEVYPGNRYDDTCINFIVGYYSQ